MEKPILYDNLKELFYNVELHRILSFDLIEVKEGYCVTSVMISEKHLNPHGIVHGGVPFLLADTSMGIAIRTTGMLGVTIDMNIHYFSPIENNTLLTCRAWVEKSGSKIIIAGAEFIDSLTNSKKGVVRATFFNKNGT